MCEAAADLVLKSLESIEADKLVLITGAGISRAAPSQLPTARETAARCYAEYLPILPDATYFDPALEHNLEGLANYFLDRHTLQSLFIGRLVPWPLFHPRPSNEGHFAVADFLLSRALLACITTNYDCLVERSAESIGGDIQACLDGDEANDRLAQEAPYLKIHGCLCRDRPHTVWTPRQITEDGAIAGRIAHSHRWLSSFLRNKHLLIVGFSSDWDYLNNILESVLRSSEPDCVTVIDPESCAALALKAPNMWTLFTKVGLRHVQQDGKAFLASLNEAFARTTLRRVYSTGVAMFTAETGAPPAAEHLDAPPVASLTDLYDLRRDAGGISRATPIRSKHTEGNPAHALCHLLLLKAGAVREGAQYKHGTHRIRLINGRGHPLVSLKTMDSAAPPAAIPAYDFVICAGATETVAPARLIDRTRPDNFFRHASSTKWLDLPTARHALGF